METTHNPQGNNRHESAVQLIRGIFQDTQRLFSKEVLAAKLEVKEEIAKGVRAAIALGVGGFVLAIGFILLSLMLVFLLATFTPLPLWASLGIVGLLYSIVGGGIIWSGKQKVVQVKPFPDESVESAKQDVRYIAERAIGH